MFNKRKNRINLTEEIHKVNAENDHLKQDNETLKAENKRLLEKINELKIVLTTDLQSNKKLIAEIQSVNEKALKYLK